MLSLLRDFLRTVSSRKDTVGHARQVLPAVLFKTQVACMRKWEQTHVETKHIGQRHSYAMQQLIPCSCCSGGGGTIKIYWFFLSNSAVVELYVNFAEVPFMLY